MAVPDETQGGVMVVRFTMSEPSPKKHSVCFHFEKLESAQDGGAEVGESFDAKPLQGASFYVPRPLAENAKRIRVTIEEL